MFFTSVRNKYHYYLDFKTLICTETTNATLSCLLAGLDNINHPYLTVTREDSKITLI